MWISINTCTNRFSFCRVSAHQSCNGHGVLIPRGPQEAPYDLPIGDRFLLPPRRRVKQRQCFRELALFCKFVRYTAKGRSGIRAGARRRQRAIEIAGPSLLRGDIVSCDGMFSKGNF